METATRTPKERWEKETDKITQSALASLDLVAEGGIGLPSRSKRLEMSPRLTL